MSNYKLTQSGTQVQTDLDKVEDITASVTELNYTTGVTSAIQTQLNAKQPNLNSANSIYVSGATIGFKNNLSNDVKVTISITEPATASDGDIWFKY